jgi:hypothetical protein
MDGEDAKTATISGRKSYIGALGGILGIALAVLLIVWLVEGRGPSKSNQGNSNEIITVEKKDASEEKQPDQLPPGQEDPVSERAIMPAHVAGTDIDEGARPDGHVVAKVEKPLPLPKIPTILVIVSGDEYMISSARAHLYSKMRDEGLKILSFTEVPLLREKMQFGAVPVTWYDIQQIAPADKAQVLVLAEIKKTGTMPLHYMGRSEELTVASFSFQAVDMETGESIHSSTSESINFTSLNMNEKLQEGISNTTEGMEEEIRLYWKKKRVSRERSR